MAGGAAAFSGSSGAIISRRAVYLGFSFRETAGTTATLKIYDGTSAAGTLLETVQLNANESRAEYYGPDGVSAERGIYVSVVAGTVEGSVRLR